MNKIIISRKELNNLIEGYIATCHLESAGMILNTYEIEIDESI